MIRILLSGAGGKMGGAVADACDPLCIVVAGIDINDTAGSSFPIYKSYDDVQKIVDVIIDASHPDSLSPLLKYAIMKSLPLVLATTGYDKEQEEIIREASYKIPIMRSPNFSIGISVLLELAKKAAALLPGCDIEIVEAHHRMKTDSPSGTALTIANALTEGSPCRGILKGRKPEDGRRESNQIGIHSIRGGTGTGDHSVLFLMDGESIELKHSSHGREIFARGALQAAKWLVGKPAGLYSMKDMMRSTT